MKSALEAANEAWDKAPMHIRMMAGEYVAPILAALADQQRQIDVFRGRLDAFDRVLTEVASGVKNASA